MIARVPHWAGAADLRTSLLAGGITNQNYRVEVGGETFVLRISGANTELLGINREHEHAAHAAAAELGIAPEVIYFIQPEGYLVTRFVSGRPLPPEEIRRPDNIRRVVMTLQQIHRLPPIPVTFSPFRTVEKYAETARRYGVTFPDNFDWLIARMGDIETAFSKHPFTPRLCHNDLLNENFLDDGRIRVLDWEYAGMGDVFFDLANFAVHHDFSDEQERFLLECYFSEATPARLARLKLMKIMSDFREAMWGMVQIGISTLDFDFRGYADKHFDRMTRNLQDPGCAQWLTEVVQGV
ncbi:MAG: phosphotransferase [Anaerolineae bacterium]